MLSLYYQELIAKIEEHEGKHYLMVNDNILDKVFDKIKRIVGIGKFDDTKILINTDDKLPNNITLNNVVVLITCVISL